MTDASAHATCPDALLADLRRHSELADELRATIADDGTLDNPRLALAVLSTITLAARAGCRPPQVRRVVDIVVREGLADARDREVAAACARHAVRLVDAIYLLGGHERFAPGGVRDDAEMASLLELEAASRSA